MVRKPALITTLLDKFMLDAKFLDAYIEIVRYGNDTDTDSDLI